GAGRSTSPSHLAVGPADAEADTYSRFVEKPEFPVSKEAHWQCVPDPTRDSRLRSGESAPESARGSAVGRAATSVARTISIPPGANGASSRGEPRRERPAS